MVLLPVLWGSKMKRECMGLGNMLTVREFAWRKVGERIHELHRTLVTRKWLLCIRKSASLIVFPINGPDILMMMIITIKSRCPEV